MTSELPFQKGRFNPLVGALQKGRFDPFERVILTPQRVTTSLLKIVSFIL